MSGEDTRLIEPAGTVIEVEGIDGQHMRFVSNGHVWLGCVPGETFQGFAPKRINAAYAWWVVAEPVSVASGRMAQ